MNRNGLIKAFTKNVTKKQKVIGKYIPKHLDITFPIYNTILSISSTSKEDSIKHEGAFLIIINGLDKNYEEQNDIVKLKGQTQQLSSKEFLRINNVIVIECGKYQKNIGNIYITSNNDTLINGIPQTYLYHTIGKGENISCCGIYTVPKRYTMQFKQYNTTADISYFDRIIVNNYVDPPNFYTMDIAEIFFDKFNSNIEYPIMYATPIGETSDLKITVRKKSLFNWKTKFGCYFQFILIPNE